MEQGLRLSAGPARYKIIAMILIRSRQTTLFLSGNMSEPGAEGSSRPEWTFIGRHDELTSLRRTLGQRRWFFVKITGRRRIGKTTLVRHALEGSGRSVLYVQLPDSGEAGVLSQIADAMDTFAVPEDQFPRPHTMNQLAKTIEALARAGYVIVLDEFQYLNRKLFSEFCSLLQAAVDRLSADAARVPGGLIVLGSVYTEMVALLEERTAPLYNRVTESLELGHLDISSVLAILSRFAEATPERLLFFWSLFEGVPKFYRDAFEQDVLDADRADVLRRMFFESSSPLRAEADTWFLSELRGQYDMVLKFVARKPGRRNGELVREIESVVEGGRQKISSYLKVLAERYRLIERKQPVFAKPKARQGRYYLTDNFLQSWLAALSNLVAARDFRPVDRLVQEADERLCEVEGFALERLAGRLYEERSRKGIGDFPLSARVQGFWDRGGIEIDLVVISDELRTIRFGSCKRSAKKLLADVNHFRGHVDRYLANKPLPSGWRWELVAIAPVINSEQRAVLARHDVVPQDLNDLTDGLIPGGQRTLL